MRRVFEVVLPTGGRARQHEACSGPLELSLVEEGARAGVTMAAASVQGLPWLQPQRRSLQGPEGENGPGSDNCVCGL